MSSQAPGQGTAPGPAPGHGAQPATSPAGPAASNPAPATGTSNLSNQNLNQIVTDYLLKRGFNRTEEIFRQESKHLGPDGRPLHQSTNVGPKKYLKAFKLLQKWVDSSLDIYKFELSKLLWPIFVYSFLELLSNSYVEDAKAFLNEPGRFFSPVHDDDLKKFSTMSLPQHVEENYLTRMYKDNKYRIPLNQHATADLFNFLEHESDQGGAVIRQLLVSHCEIDSTARGPIHPYSFEAIFRRSQNREMDEIDAQEGVPGVNIGILNKDVLDPSAPLKLGPLPMEPELRDDVRAELEDLERRNPPPDGKSSLVDEFDQRIKREESVDVPSRADLPLPPSRPRDILLEMQKIRENRDRFKIEGRTGGIGPAVTVCMYTFHNTLGCVNCIDFSDDCQMAAVGTSESYIRVWSMDGKELPSVNSYDKDNKVNSRKLIGHMAPVFDVCFSDSAYGPPQKLFGEEGKELSPLDTRPKLLISCAADGHVRLWSLESWACLCLYKSHDGPAYRTLWSPQGHYFMSAGYDKVVRLWAQDHVSPLRFMVGHDTSISAIAWHPNGLYLFSASDETDMTIRMWSVMTGQCVRVFSGHNDYISALECAPNGTILASADCSGNIVFWDVNKGTRIKRSRGHGRGGIWSLSFSVESTALVSGGQDGTVRVWDVESPADPQKAAQHVGLDATVSGADGSAATNGAPDANRIGASSGPQAAPSTGPGLHKKKAKEVMVTPDQISVFFTKRTPVTKVKFTRMNLIIAGGCYDAHR
ncbi:hypothetical protein CDD82_4759 [Ophiocordyceps australis]|uniref:TFIID subunit TAF5 NTD2 domain-containing protein n=1 Tax=Ophiocordyceps australis TaxID=1399860 RepID=A0A2C5Z495_9HYPO|nr:hypothetical protein CDD82_4759 [Ophiocordyceps australis]